jgi:hypothetical protein
MAKAATSEDLLAVFKKYRDETESPAFGAITDTEPDLTGRNLLAISQVIGTKK